MMENTHIWFPWHMEKQWVILLEQGIICLSPCILMIQSYYMFQLNLKYVSNINKIHTCWNDRHKSYQIQNSKYVCQTMKIASTILTYLLRQFYDVLYWGHPIILYLSSIISYHKLLFYLSQLGLGQSCRMQN